VLLLLSLFEVVGAGGEDDFSPPSPPDFVADDSEVFSDVVLAGVSLVPVVVSLFRLSVMYQPDPLKTIPTGWNTFRHGPPHVGQVRIGSSSIL
jgi:hypothetical protein